MKTRFKHPANRLRASVLLCGVLAAAAHAAVPLSWETRPGSPAPVSFDRHHGETLELRCTLSGFGQDGPVFAQGADIRLWFQTNGMGSVWWSAPAAVASNVITATWSPDLDPGADRVSIFLGAPSNVYASAVLRLRHSPGFTPASLPIPVPPLDFAGLEVLNAPYYTQAETDARIVELSPAAQPPGNYLAVSNAAMSAAAQSDLISATNALAMSTATAFGSYLPLSGGLLTGDLSLSGAASIQYTGVWYVRLYANAGTAGNRIYTNEGDTWQSERGLAWLDETTNHVHVAAVAATNYTDSSISAANPAFAAAVRNVPITGADSSDLAEIAEYGSYGTVGAAILALIAGLAALKRGKFDIAGETRSVTATYSGGTNTYKFAGGGEEDDSTVARIGDIPYKRMTATEMLLGVYGLVTRAVTGFVASSGATTATFGFGSTPGGDTVIDCLLDVDNSGNSSDFGLEFHGLGTSYALAVNADDVSSSKTAGEVLAEMTVVEAGTRARLYFTEASQTQVAIVGNESVDLPILTVQRMTIVPTTVQGGAS